MLQYVLIVKFSWRACEDSEVPGLGHVAPGTLLCPAAHCPVPSLLSIPCTTTRPQAASWCCAPKLEAQFTRKASYYWKRGVLALQARGDSSWPQIVYCDVYRVWRGHVGLGDNRHMASIQFEGWRWGEKPDQ